MQRFISLLFALLPLFTLGADTVGTNHLYVAAIGQYNLNKWNVYNSSEQPNLMQSQNTIGNSISLGYRRVTKYGLIIMVGVGFSTKHHDISLQKNIQDYDPSSLINQNVNTQLKIRIQSIDPEFMIGYRKVINKKQALIFKTGVVQKRFLTSERQSKSISSIYPISNNNYRFNRMYSYDIYMGMPPKTYGTLDKIISNPLLFQFSFGVESKCNYKYIKYLSVDMDMIFIKPIIYGNLQEVQVFSDNNVNTSSVSTSNYIDRFASIGLRVSMGLWK
jgi:hypothetical protein